MQRYVETGDPSKLSVPHIARIDRILFILDMATSLGQIAAPGLRLHRLKGRDAGRWAVDASANWRITFGWDGIDAVAVDLEDYH